MPSITIDNRRVEVPRGGTILDAAHQIGLDIPTLCFAEGQPPLTSCMICLVKLPTENRFVPSCATLVEDGMEIESETEEVWQIRRTGLDLLLSDHAGDCLGPCQNACPCHMDIPLMLRQVAAGKLDDAIATVKRDIALPAVLGRVCPEVCEGPCRRREVDDPVAICLVKRHVADIDLALPEPYVPPLAPATGKKVAIVGAGPTGLSAAYHLRRVGHSCTLFDRNSEPGGMLRRDFDERQLPRAVLDAEITTIRRLGIVFQLGTEIGAGRPLKSLAEEFDAVLVATGSSGDIDADHMGLRASGGRLVVDSKTHETSLPGVFAAGDVVKPRKLVVQAVADGKAAAVDMDRFLTGVRHTGKPKAFNVRLGRLTPEEIKWVAAEAHQGARAKPSDNSGSGLTVEQARAEAARCLDCECGSAVECRLRRYSQLYGASPNRYRTERKAYERFVQVGDGDANIVFEPGKCILCGLCVQIATEAGEPLGLTFFGRGFDMRVGVPFDRPLAEGLTFAASQCADACPTGALVLRVVGSTKAGDFTCGCSHASELS